MAWKQLIMFWMLNVKFYNLTILQFYNHASALDHSGCYINVLACSICCEAKFHKNWSKIQCWDKIYPNL